MNTQLFYVHPVALAAMLALAPSGSVFAQTQAAPPAAAASAPAAARSATGATADADPEVIVVTAQKRSEAIKDVPIVIRAFSGATLQQEGIITPTDLTRIVPSLKINSAIGTLSTRVAIRGIGTYGNSAIEPSVATFINGIYVPRPASIINSLFDVEAVEVLSGPQGTLFGRNASVGAFTYRTGTPQFEFGGSARAEVASGDRYRAEGVVNVPVGESVSFRIAALADEFGGYWHTVTDNKRFGGVDTHAARITMLADITPDLTWTLRGDYQKNKGDGTLNGQLDPSTVTPTTYARFVSELGGAQPTLDQFGKRNNLAVDNNHIDDTYKSASSDLAYTNSGYTVRLLQGYNDWDSPQSDGDTAVLPIYVVGRNLDYGSRSNSHELQLISPKDKLLGGKVDFVAGVYYFHEDYRIRIENLNGPNFCNVLIPLPALAGAFGGVPGTTTAAKIASCQGYGSVNSYGDFRQKLDSGAAYTQATYKLLPVWDVTAGVRYTHEKKTGHYEGNVVNPTGRLFSTIENTDLELKGSRFTWRANTAFRPNTDLMLFATASTGFKSGGFNNGVGTALLGQQRIFRPETTKNYEVGAKSQWLNRTLTLNATVFQMTIDNYQERGATGLTATTRNVGSVRQRGVEFDGNYRVLTHLRVNAALTYLNSEVLSYCGAPIPPYRTAPAGSCPGALANSREARGDSLNYNPRWAGSVGAALDGSFGGSGWHWLLNGDTNFNARQNLAFNLDNGPLTKQGGYTLYNARFTVAAPRDQWSVGVYGRNLTNKGYCGAKVYQTLAGPFGLNYDANGDGVNDGQAVRCLVAPPRVVGLTGTVKF